MKERLDVLLVRQGLAESREKAKAVIMAGCVYVNDQKEDKAGAMFDETRVQIEVRGNTLRYVSRGGLKLEKAIGSFDVCLDGRFHRLYAPKRGAESLRCGCGAWPAGVEAPQ